MSFVHVVVKVVALMFVSPVVTFLCNFTVVVVVVLHVVVNFGVWKDIQLLVIKIGRTTRDQGQKNEENSEFNKDVPPWDHDVVRHHIPGFNNIFGNIFVFVIRIV